MESNTTPESKIMAEEQAGDFPSLGSEPKKAGNPPKNTKNTQGKKKKGKKGTKQIAVGNIDDKGK